MNSDIYSLQNDDFSTLGSLYSATEVPAPYKLSKVTGYKASSSFMNHGNFNLMANSTANLSSYSSLTGRGPMSQNQKLSSTQGYDINVPASNNYFSYSGITRTQ